MLGEFDIIERYFNRKNQRDDVILGVGDDAAVLQVPSGKELIVTMDTLVSGVHFPQQTEAEAIGHKALAVNLSDLASMGAVPAWFTLAMTLPEVDTAWLDGFARGLFDLADRHNVVLVGGDMTHGPLSLSITAMGFSAQSKALRRDGANPGDGIFVTGYIGDAGLALKALKRQLMPEESDLDYLLQRLDYPEPRVEVGLALVEQASSAIDISDGLTADLNHILEASGVGASIQLSRLPLSPAFLRTCTERPEWQIPLAAGDDYELLFTLPPHQVERLTREMATVDYRITQIGQVEAQRGLRIWDCEGKKYTLQCSGYTHFET